MSGSSIRGLTWGRIYIGAFSFMSNTFLWETHHIPIQKYNVVSVWALSLMNVQVSTFLINVGIPQTCFSRFLIHTCYSQQSMSRFENHNACCWYNTDGFVLNARTHLIYLFTILMLRRRGIRISFEGFSIKKFIYLHDFLFLFNSAKLFILISHKQINVDNMNSIEA